MSGDMSFETLRSIFGFCALFNVLLFIFWIVFITLFKKWTYKMQKIFFDIPQSEFEKVMYNFLALYKILLLLFFVMPWLAMVVCLP